eukprot:CAMPEP_0174828770 /NCGR_PEP_ID=MMETSP1114-20130205/1528_1 /TAXON_ID=312471 /ORGANISM="Neobodo designis, Strain CCAP 1951/1" /LENGTH=332 /DNA_ID=CAMNT_0016062495 /DNA_START=27 /DNA_END=1021 /DNA_ORIENTATION=+
MSIVLFLVLGAVVVGATPWWEPASIFDDNTTDRLLLLSNATRLSYVSTHGSYYNPSDANATLAQAGWIRGHEENPEFGFHAIAFVNPAAARLLIAIRGTDLNVSGLSGQADVCADHFLWDAPPDFANFSGAPDFCAKFNRSTLDYFGAARSFLASAKASYPGYHVLLTGHSLGAGLAAMLALWPSSGACPGPANDGAAVFSAPDYLYALRRRTNESFGDAQAYRVAVVADEFDPVFYRAKERAFEGMVGWRGLWVESQTGAPSVACEVCDLIEHAKSLETPFCFACMLTRHVFSHYEALVASGGVPKNISRVQLCTGSETCRQNPCASPCCG